MARATIRRNVLRIATGVVIGAAVVFPIAFSSSAEQDPATPAPDAGLDPDMVELVAAHNRERAKEKLAPLTANAQLTAAARIHARDMAEHEMMSHEGSDGSKF